MPFRPLYPALAGNQRQGHRVELLSPPKRASQACTSCQKKRKRCSGMPPCSECIKTNSHCVFNRHNDRRRKLALKHVEDLLASSFEVLRTGTDEDIEQLRVSVKQEPLEASPLESFRNILSTDGRDRRA